jgi:hypothetical protein
MGGIKYPAISSAAIEIGSFPHWLISALRKNDGGPVVVKKQVVVTDFWVRRRVEGDSRE